MRRWGRSRAMEGAVLPGASRRGVSTRQLTSTIEALHEVYDRTHAPRPTAPGPDARASAPIAAAAPASALPAPRPVDVAWAFLSDHARVLVRLALAPDAPSPVLARLAGVPEAALGTILAELVADGYVTRRGTAGGWAYRVEADRPLRHPGERGRCVGDLLAVWGGSGGATGRPADELARARAAAARPAAARPARTIRTAR